MQVDAAQLFGNGNRIIVHMCKVLITMLLLASCSNKTKMDSDEYNLVEERVEALKLELIEKSDFTDTEFELFNVNGFHDASGWTVPGASSWDYKFVVKVDTSDVLKWAEGIPEVDSLTGHQDWMADIVKRDAAKWRTTSKPAFYETASGDVEVAVFYREGIVFKRITQN